MKKCLKILFHGWLVFIGFATFASPSDVKTPLLFADRGFCVSGDSVWVMLKLPANFENEDVVARFQIEAIDGGIIDEVAVESSGSWARGFIIIPDSLSTGQYFITAFLLNGADNQIKPVTKSLLVYNRFDEDIAQINLAKSNSAEIVDNKLTEVQIKTDSEAYKTRERVNIRFGIPANFNISEAVIRATITDPLEKELPGYRFSYQFPSAPAPGFVEKGGYLVSGRVTGINGVVQPGVLVVVSLTTPESYFDYCVTDSAGIFHFFMKNAFGATDAVFQVFSGSDRKFEIHPENCAPERTGLVNTEPVVLTSEQISFIKNALNSSFASRIFNPANLVQNEFFSMEIADSIPFYGPPTVRVRPEEFIDLPDFREISRELLPGFQYRVRNENHVFRMLNRTRGEFFKEEPLRLINGIPVFNNQLFTTLKSTEISHVDLVLYERVYGDLIINGVLEVSLKDKSNAWLGNRPNLFRRNINFLQPYKNPGYLSETPAKPGEPDTRQVFVWKKVAGTPEDFSFELSDRKGVVEISVEGFTRDNRYFKSVKIIEVK
ncbi:MAG TPA: hypothetical protein DER09_01200 [Prolixibacteraceae bacterium]|nr:hypothetical protein [Prolixibacteraceae bacterium]